ncbi:MAG: aminopeptidase [Anaerolineales bacterium]
MGDVSVPPTHRAEVILGDPRISRMADLLVNYSVRVGGGDWTLIAGDISALPLIREVHRSVLMAGGHPQILITDEHISLTLLQLATDEQLDWVAPGEREMFERADVFINVSGAQNTRALTRVDPTRQAKRHLAKREMFEAYLRRSASGDLRWVTTRFPTQASAQEAEMSLSEYETFIYQACKLNRPDPIAEWERLSRSQQSIIDWLRGKQEIRLTGPNCNLRLSVAGRKWVSGDGRNNMPDGEVFTSPVEDSAEGWVRFTYPLVWTGQVVEGAELTFSKGNVVKATASKGEAFLRSQLAMDAGAGVMGEFAIGTNQEITRFSGDALFDEKIGGTIHVAMGHGFEQAGGMNKSALHWDLVTDMRDGGRITADGELFYESGAFTI